MAVAATLAPAAGALALLILLVLGYALYQVRGYRLLCNGYRRLRDLKASQRQVYRDLEGLQTSCSALLARVPSAARPAPYTADDERIIALRAKLLERLAGLHRQIRPLEPGSQPAFTLRRFLGGRFWPALRAAERELIYARSLRRELAQAQTLARELEALLANLDRRPQEVVRALADVQALAGLLAEDLAGGEQQGKAGLASLIPEVQAVRAEAAQWAARLAVAPAAEAPQVAIEAEALRLGLLARLAGLHGQAESIAGAHDQALGGQVRLDAALQESAAHLAALRPELAAALRPALQALGDRRGELVARYADHNVLAYRDVAQQAWVLMAQARSLDQQIAGLAEMDRQAVQAVEECIQVAKELRRQLDEERGASAVLLDQSEAALERVERATARLRDLAAGKVAKLPADCALLAAWLGEVEAQADLCRKEQAAALEGLVSWQALHQRIEQILARLAATTADHERLTRAWRDLQGYSPANWPELQADWYDRYVQERRRILAAAEEIQKAMAGGQAKQSAVGQLVAAGEALAGRWQALWRDGQDVLVVLGQVQAVERQVQEGIAALQADVAAVAGAEEELPAEMAAAAELRDLGHDIVEWYRELCQEAQQPAQADLRRLRDEALTGLHEQLAMHRLSYVQLVDSERAALRRQLAQLWEQWEPFNQRLAKATPASKVDRRAFRRSWAALVLAARAPLLNLQQALELRTQAEGLARAVAAAQQEFQAERETVRQAEQRLAQVRRAATHLRESLPRLLAHPHPMLVSEEWERSNKAWRKGESILRRLEPQRSVPLYLERLDEVVGHYEEARSRARSALARLLRYAFLENPEGMHEVCLPMGPDWGRLGVTAREEHICKLLLELEQNGLIGQLAEQVGNYFAARRAASG